MKKNTNFLLLIWTCNSSSSSNLRSTVPTTTTALSANGNRDILNSTFKVSLFVSEEFSFGGGGDCEAAAVEHNPLAFFPACVTLHHTANTSKEYYSKIKSSSQKLTTTTVVFFTENCGG